MFSNNNSRSLRLLYLLVSSVLRSSKFLLVLSLTLLLTRYFSKNSYNYCSRKYYSLVICKVRTALLVIDEVCV